MIIFRLFLVKYYDLIFSYCNNISHQHWWSISHYAAYDFECNSPAGQFSIQQDLVYQLLKDLLVESFYIKVVTLNGVLTSI